MSLTFMNSESRKNSDSYKLYGFIVLVLNLAYYLDIPRGDKHVALSDFSIYYTWKNIRTPYGNNKFKISRTTSDEQFELPNGCYTVSDIQDYFGHVIKNHETLQMKHSPNTCLLNS